MSSCREISHRGKIIEITPEVTRVEIISESACSACHAKGLCGASESKVKVIEVATRGWDNWSVGDEVNVCLKSSMGHKAVWVAYVIPLVVLMTVLLGLDAAGMSEIMSGLLAIAATGVYYFIIWLLRDRLNNEYIFNVK